MRVWRIAPSCTRCAGRTYSCRSCPLHHRMEASAPLVSFTGSVHPVLLQRATESQGMQILEFLIETGSFRFSDVAHSGAAEFITVAGVKRHAEVSCALTLEKLKEGKLRSTTWQLHFSGSCSAMAAWWRSVGTPCGVPSQQEHVSPDTRSQGFDHRHRCC